MWLIRFVLCWYCLETGCGVYSYEKVNPQNDDSTEPLILTPLIKQGHIEKARTAAEVKFNEFKGIKSYSGYFTVNELCNSNIFFWFFPSQRDYMNAPLILWLTGGPGDSSMLQAFDGIGPYEITSESCLKLGKYSWIQNHSVLYIDNPVGTGYSFTNENGYAKNQTIIGEQLYEALVQFFELFPELQSNAFYVAGVSYGGKYVPAAAYAIHKNNLNGSFTKINLRGIAIGNGWSDPKRQSVYADYLYQIGLADFNAKVEIKDMEVELSHYIRNEQWLEASKQYDRILRDNTSFFDNVTGSVNSHNYLLTMNGNVSKSFEIAANYLQREDVRKALHVGKVPFHAESGIVFSMLRNDIMQSVSPWIEELLDHYKVLIYNGQLDVMVAYRMTVNFLKHLKFTGADEYKTAARHIWHVGKDLAGYVKKAGNLMEVLVRNAGHDVMSDKPYWALDLITKFTHNTPLSRYN